MNKTNVRGLLLPLVLYRHWATLQFTFIKKLNSYHRR